MDAHGDDDAKEQIHFRDSCVVPFALGGFCCVYSMRHGRPESFPQTFTKEHRRWPCAKMRAGEQQITDLLYAGV